LPTTTIVIEHSGHKNAVRDDFQLVLQGMALMSTHIAVADGVPSTLTPAIPESAVPAYAKPLVPAPLSYGSYGQRSPAFQSLLSSLYGRP
jgi:hypothetical protein